MGKTMLHARVDDSLHAWIKKEFPHGFIQIFVEDCFVHLRTLVDEGRMPAPSEYARRATINVVADIIKTQIESGEEE